MRYPRRRSTECHTTSVIFGGHRAGNGGHCRQMSEDPSQRRRGFNWRLASVLAGTPRDVASIARSRRATPLVSRRARRLGPSRRTSKRRSAQRSRWEPTSHLRAQPRRRCRARGSGLDRPHPAHARSRVDAEVVAVAADKGRVLTTSAEYAPRSRAVAAQTFVLANRCVRAAGLTCGVGPWRRSS